MTTLAPGWLTNRNNGESKRILVEHIKHCVPENGVVVELGTMFGSTTQLIAEHAPATSKIYTVDLWLNIPRPVIDSLMTCSSEQHNQTMQTILRNLDPLVAQKHVPGNVVYDWWKQFTNHIPNLTHYRHDVTTIDLDLIPNADLIIQDAQHNYDGVMKELEYWWPKLKPGGTLIIDDYNQKQFPGLIRATKEFFNNNEYTIKIGTDCYYLIVKK